MAVRVVALAGDGIVATSDRYVETLGPDGWQPSDVGAVIQVFEGDGEPVSGPIERDAYGAAPVAAPTGAFAVFTQGGLPRGGNADLSVQRFTAEGEVAAAPIRLDDFDPALGRYGGPGLPLFGSLDADNTLAAVWRYTGSDFIGSSPPTMSYLAHATFDADGDPASGPARIDEWTQAHGLLALPDGQTLAYTAGGGGQLVQLQPLDAHGLPVGDPLPAQYGDLYPWAFVDQAVVLADGSIGLFLIDQLVNPGSNQSILVQVDATGARLRDPVPFDLPYGPGLDPIGHRFFATQEGGFVAVWRERIGEDYHDFYRAFGRDGAALTAVTQWSGADAMAVMDNGRITLVDAAGDGTLSMALLDIPATYTPIPGGTIAAIQHWQDQEPIVREDGVATLVTSDSVALKSFIPNLTVVGSSDLNAGGNDLANLMIGNDGDNILVGYLGNDELRGEFGDDFLAAGRGQDRLFGEAGDDIVWGGQGDDMIFGGAGADMLNGDRHDDLIEGGDGDDAINGGAHEDTLLGNDGADSITGGQGADRLHGGAGADTLRGDRDDDFLVGGDGADRFVFAAGFGRDTIDDFNLVDGDRIVVEVVGGAIDGVTVDDAGDLWAFAADSGQGVLVTIGAGHSILLAGTAKADLGPDMFALAVI